MCISLPSEHIALKNPVCFVLFMIDKERQKKKNHKISFSAAALHNGETYKNREKDNYFFNRSITKWQNVSAEVEICKTLVAGIYLKNEDKLI